MKSTQISPMFLSLTETEEASLCGGETKLVFKSVYHKVITVKGSAGKPEVKKKIVQSASITSTSTTKVLKTTKKAEIPQGKLFDFLSSVLNFDW